MKRRYIIFIMLSLLLPDKVTAGYSPVIFTDSCSREIVIERLPRRVVSLVPSITEILLHIGAGKSLVGITYQSILPPGKGDAEIIGGFLHPDIQKIISLKPDLIFYSNLQKEIINQFIKNTTMIELSAHSIAESFDHIQLLGQIFQKEKNAADIILAEEYQLKIISRKTALIPQKKRLRVLRLMGVNSVMTPGENSFQTDYIRAAGGIALNSGQTGEIIPLTLDQWQDFNPQFLYGCGKDRQILQFLDQPGWRDVDAVRNRRFASFPCNLTCRAATHSGYFVSWLAANIYGREFSQKENFVLPEQIVKRSSLKIDINYIKKAERVTSDIKDFRNKSVILTFKHPMKILSTLEGLKANIVTIANHYFPPPSWGLDANQGLPSLRDNTLKILGLKNDSTAILFTGADMDNMVISKEIFRDMEVVALVTAGVTGNAVRMSYDTGSFYEPDNLIQPKKHGTINILLLSNMQLSSRAMTRAIISATEAKSAALQDLDIRSSYSPIFSQATGTGTDNIIVIEGRGEPIDVSGGHSKIGELIANVVYKGVQKAIYLQNGLNTKRSIFQRLKERKIDLQTICRRYAAEGQETTLCQTLESLLLQPEYENFIKALLPISDQYEKGLVNDLSSLDLWFRNIAIKIGGPGTQLVTKEIPSHPELLSRGFGALLSGITKKANRKNEK